VSLPVTTACLELWQLCVFTCDNCVSWPVTTACLELWQLCVFTCDNCVSWPVTTACLELWQLCVFTCDNCVSRPVTVGLEPVPQVDHKGWEEDMEELQKVNAISCKQCWRVKCKILIYSWLNVFLCLLIYMRHTLISWSYIPVNVRKWWITWGKQARRNSWKSGFSNVSFTDLKEQNRRYWSTRGDPGTFVDRD
jgi:hypothetical protein